MTFLSRHSFLAPRLDAQYNLHLNDAVRVLHAPGHVERIRVFDSHIAQALRPLVSHILVFAPQITVKVLFAIDGARATNGPLVKDRVQSSSKSAPVLDALVQCVKLVGHLGSESKRRRRFCKFVESSVRAGGQTLPSYNELVQCAANFGDLFRDDSRVWVYVAPCVAGFQVDFLVPLANVCLSRDTDGLAATFFDTSKRTVLFAPPSKPDGVEAWFLAPVRPISLILLVVGAFVGDDYKKVKLAHFGEECAKFVFAHALLDYGSDGNFKIDSVADAVEYVVRVIDENRDRFASLKRVAKVGERRKAKCLKFFDELVKAHQSAIQSVEELAPVTVLPATASEGESALRVVLAAAQSARSGSAPALTTFRTSQLLRFAQNPLVEAGFVRRLPHHGALAAPASSGPKITPPPRKQVLLRFSGMAAWL